MAAETGGQGGVLEQVGEVGEEAVMKLSDFHVGLEFYSETGKWRCTDVGARVVVAIKLEGEPSCWNGPPYSVAETVFDEHDFGGVCLELMGDDQENE